MSRSFFPKIPVKRVSILIRRILTLLSLLPVMSPILSSKSWAEKPPKLSPQRIIQLTEDGDRLADQGDYQAALEKYTRAYLGVVARIRGQDFMLPVKPSTFSREELGEEMLRMMAKEYTDEELALMDNSYKVFGLIPIELDSAQLMTSLLTEEVAGFYDPDNKRMVLIVEDASDGEPTWLGRLFGAKPAFDKDEQKTTLAHELTHALQDQLYDLNAMEAKIEDDDDMLLAFSALVEGDATLLMFAEAGDQDISEMDADSMRAAFNIMSWMMPLAGGKTYRSAPPIFRESLVFPYFQGMLFTLAVAGKNGWESVHAAYQQPPLSTEQIMHPAKYTTDVDNPQRVELPELKQVVGSQWKHLGGNCLGELQASILLKKVPGGRAAAEGWDGDRYEVFESDTGKLAVAFVSIWDSERDAEEFASAYRTYRQPPPIHAEEVGTGQVQDQPNPPEVQANATESKDTLGVFAGDSQLEVQVHGDRVWVVEGFNSALTSAVITHLEECKFTEKKFHR